MAEPTYELLITDSSEIEIKGTNEVPIIVSKPYYESVKIKYSNYTAVHWIGKKRHSHTFHSDDIVKTLEVMRNGGDEKGVGKAIATNVIWAELLVKHCKKIIIKEDKKKKLENKRKPKENVKKPKENVRKSKEIKIEPINTKNILDETDLNVNTNVKLSQWI